VLKAILALVLTRRPVVLLAVVAFLAAGVAAFSKLNIEAYPNPAPVILEITAQAPGLSAEEMERYYTRPMEVGLATTPGVDNIRSTSSYGLSFVRVTFKYGVEYYFAYTQAALSLQQKVSLPNGVSAQIQASSLVGEIFRYQLVGPPHFGLTNLRTLQDWVVQRRLLTVPGVAQVVTWGGTTQQYEVEADMTRLQGYGITLPQLIAAVGNANTNVGGRTINVGQQSVNIRGVGLIRDTTDIGNVVLSQTNGAPVRVKDVAAVRVGYLPRLGKAGRDDQDDVVTAIVVMNRTLRTNEVLARVKDAVESINHEGTLNVTVDRAKAARYGLNTGDVNTVVQAAAGGTQATTVLEGDRQFGLTVRLKPEYRSSLDAVRSILVGYSTPGGTNAYIPLRELASITLDTGASYIYHESNERYIPVKFSVRGRDLGSTVADAEARIRDNVKLPQGYRIKWAGEFEELRLAQRRLEIVAPIAIGAILLLLYMLFNSLRDSLLTLAGIPFSAAGGLIALYVSGLNLSISAAIGFVSLFGVSVMNGILILTYFNHLVAEGKEPSEAMRYAAQQQMRPMLLMALSACIARARPRESDDES